MADTEPREVEFTRLWTKAQPLVTSYVFSSVRHTQDAEDLLQEVATAALSDIDKYDHTKPFLHWVLGIARFRVLTYFRQRSKQKLVFDEATLAFLAEAHEQLEPTAGERRHALDECLKEVATRRREALAMRYADGLAVGDIAKRLDTSANAVSLLLHKARNSLADCIEKRLSSAEDGS